MQTAVTAAESKRELAERVFERRMVNREGIRRAVLREGRIDVLVQVLGYAVHAVHRRLLGFQDALETCLQLAPRGFCKTTMLTVCRAVFEIVRDRNVRILFASTSEKKASVPLREVKSHLEHNETLIHAFDPFYNAEKWDITEIIVAGRTKPHKEATVTCVGVGGPVAGRHYDVIFLEDVVTQDNARTEGEREKLKDWFYTTLLPARDLTQEHPRLYINGTRYHHLDLYGHLIKYEYAERHQVVDCYTDDETESTWPERVPVETLKELEATMSPLSWNLQYRNNAEFTKGDMFKDEWFRYYDTPPNWSNMRHGIGCDPAATKQAVVLSQSKTDTDWWTIVTGAMHADSQSEIYLRDIWRGRVTKDDYLQKLKALNDKYKPIVVAIESVAAQEYLAQDAVKAGLPVARVERTTDKVSRAYWLQPCFQNGQILLPDRSIVDDYSVWQALIDELLLFPNARHDDLFDGLQTLVGALLERRMTGGQDSSVLPDVVNRVEGFE